MKKDVKKQLLYLLPVYVGSLKYYEKLLPRLRETYEVQFLIIRPDDERRRGMLSYCSVRGLPFMVLDAGLGNSGPRIPLISATRKHLAHQAACRTLFDTTPNAKLVAVKAIAGFKPIFREANHRGIETIVLQSALVPPPNFYRKDADSFKISFTYRFYYSILNTLFFVSDTLMNGWSYRFVSTRPKKVGVIGKEGVEIFHTRFGFDPSTITVVGNAEYQRVSELKTRVIEDSLYRQTLLQKYGLDPKKKRILIMSVWYEHHGAVRPAHMYSDGDTKTQIAYYERIIQAIRRVCSEQDYDVLFKLHPAEKNIYESYRQFGALFFGDESISEELLVLSDLYIADPCTSANYMVVASGVPALFVNAEALPALNKCTLFYPMKRIIKNWEELDKALLAFKKGTLDAGYDESAIDKHSIDRIMEFIGK